MFIKKLLISSPFEIIRNIEFHLGINLIVDDTPSSNDLLTGNNVGKTTILKLIDFCLGANPTIVYSDTENKKEKYELVQNYLIDNEIVITLVLSEDLNDSTSKTVTIERNFLAGKKTIRKINGEQILNKYFESELQRLLIPHHIDDKPSFRQIISHNIRYRDESISNTLKTLNRFTSDVEYETLYLFLLGCTFNDGEKRQSIITEINQEKAYCERLEKKQTKTAYEVALSMLDYDIEILNKKKSSLNINENFEEDLNRLSQIKYKINKSSSLVSKLNIRKDIIQEAKTEMEQNFSKIDVNQLKRLYDEVTDKIDGIQKTFEQLVAYHNTMLIEKTKFITSELPELNLKISMESETLNGLLREEKDLSKIISKSDSFEELENIIADITEMYRLKGEYEGIISQINEVANNISNLDGDLKDIDDFLFSEKFEEIIKLQINKFNKKFSAISDELYGEKYALKHDKIVNKKGQRLYKFSAFNTNMSSGKKQGEILCFDLAYIMFADSEKMPNLHFLLNDKKELMHDNQLIKVSNFIKDKNIQLVISILKDELPSNLLNKSNIVIELSQESKLFKIESDFQKKNTEDNFTDK